VARISSGRSLFALSGAMGAVLVAAAVLAIAASPGHTTPGAILAADSDFTISGTVANLAPGVPGDLPLTVSSGFAYPITVTELGLTVAETPAGCSLAYFTVGGQAFSGTPPEVDVADLALLVPASGSASLNLAILLDRSAPNSCQDVTLQFSYGGSASASPSPSPSPTHTRRPPPPPGFGIVTVLSARPDPSLFGQRVRLTASLRGPVTPAGTVTFYRCASPSGLPSGSPPVECARAATLGRAVPVSGNGYARLTTASLPPGHVALFAVFRPVSGAYGPSYSGTITQVVRFSGPCVRSWHGQYRVRRGTAVCITGRVSGSVRVEPGGALELNGAHLTGGIAARGATAVRICGATVGGPVSISGTRGYLAIGGLAGCPANRIGGSLTLKRNQGGFTVGGNRISGSTRLDVNDGTRPPWQLPAAGLNDNTIAGSLTCRGNRPVPSGRGNKVTGKRAGQCAARAS
jgi:hypothetical protein